MIVSFMDFNSCYASFDFFTLRIFCTSVMAYCGVCRRSRTEVTISLRDQHSTQTDVPAGAE